MSQYADGSPWAGFHGDQHLLSLVDHLMKDIDFFIETGANEGVTLRWVGTNYSKEGFSCEPRKVAYDSALAKINKLNHIKLFNETSSQFLDRINKDFPSLYNKKGLFWLDAHGFGFEWPLLEEIERITMSFTDGLLLIDDFKVPGQPCFGFDSYQKQICSFSYIKDSIKKPFSLYYPSYTDHTSKHHPLRGWGLLSFGKNWKLNINHEFCEKYTIQ
jgi:hypothetical protein